MPTTYSPILRWKQGERTALQNLSPQGSANVFPIAVLYPDKAPSAVKFAEQVENCWGTPKLGVDASLISGTPAHHLLDDIRAEMGAKGLQLVPTIRGTASNEYLQAVLRTIATDDRGVVLRVSLIQMTRAATWLAQLPFAQGDTDLVVDLSGSAPNVFALGASVLQSFASLHAANGWRSITVAGGSIPPTLSAYAVGSSMLDRSEYLLWQALQAQGLPYQLQFGDYATIGPDASTDDIGGPVPFNAKYTRDLAFQILRGVRETGPGAIPRAVQYRGHAAAIMGYPGHIPLGHCWADAQLANIAANPSQSTGNPATWVAYAVNRHIELTRSQLP